MAAPLAGRRGQALAVLTVLRMVVAAVTPLAPDEAYYWVWSRALSPGYLDHPPMVAVFIRIGTMLVGDTNLGIRLLGPVVVALGSVLLARAGDDLLPEHRPGVMAAALMNATLLFGIGAVTMTPDTPLIFFWTMTLWALARVFATGRAVWWLVAGLAAGLALDSKYTAILLAPGIFTWLVLAPSLRSWLRRPGPWLAAGLALLVFLPVLVWNANHGWASFLKQGGRGGDWAPSRAGQYVGELLAGQVALATPLIAVVCTAGMVAALRRWRDPAWLLLAALSVLPALVFVQHALGDRVQANWPSVIYPAAAIAGAALVGRWARLMGPGLALGFLMTAIAWIQAAVAPFALPMRADPTLLRLGGWTALAQDIHAQAVADHASFIVSDNYGHAALLARLLPADIPVLGVEGRWRLFDLPDAMPRIAGQTGLLVRSARRDDLPDPADWARIDRLGLLDRARNGMVAEGFRLYHVQARPGNEPIVIMPRPGTVP